MSSLILPAGFSRQPIPGAPRPRFVRPNALTLDSLSQKLGPYSPSATTIPTVVSLEGVAVKGFDGYRAAWTIPSITIGTGDFTVAISWFNTNVLSDSYAYITGSSISYFAVAARHTGIGGNAGLLLPGMVWINTGISASAVGHHRLVIARRNGTAVWNVDGQRGTAASTTSIPAITGLALSGYDLAGGVGAGSADYPTFYDAYAFEPAAWADDEIDQWVENPWALYKDKPRPVYFSAATGGAAALDGAATATSTATGTLTTQIPLSGAAAVVATSSGALSTGITLAGQGAAVSLADGVLTAQITLSGTALAQALAAAGLTTGIPLVGGASGQAAAAGELSAGVGLAGAATALADAGGSLTTQIRLDGAALAQALAGGDLSTTPAGLSGAAGAQATAAGALLTGIPLAGAAQAYATAAGGLTTIIPLSGAAASVSSATGDITVESTLSGAAIALALAGGDLTTLIRLDGAAVARAAASGALGSELGIPAAIPHLVEAHHATWEIEAQSGIWEIAA